MGGARAATALTVASRDLGLSARFPIVARVTATTRAVMAVNTAKQKCPAMSMGSQQPACDITVDVIATGVPSIGAGWECPVWPVCRWTRWCMPIRPAAMTTISNH